MRQVTAVLADILVFASRCATVAPERGGAAVSFRTPAIIATDVGVTGIMAWLAAAKTGASAAPRRGAWPRPLPAAAYRPILLVEVVVLRWVCWRAKALGAVFVAICRAAPVAGLRRGWRRPPDRVHPDCAKH
ncbi:MAG: hypothetical protein M0Z53_04055 [Thermaerobacter sp.]|nr:hypothetical protein [Thermaerobacter sp.]